MTRYIGGLFLTVFILLTAVAAFAESAEVMLSACRPIIKAKINEEVVTLPENSQVGMCWGAFSVIQKVITQADYKSKKKVYGVCAPPKSTRTQLITIFVNYAEKNPQRLHEDFFYVAMDSLKESFKCK